MLGLRGIRRFVTGLRLGVLLQFLIRFVVPLF